MRSIMQTLAYGAPASVALSVILAWIPSPEEIRALLVTVI